MGKTSAAVTNRYKAKAYDRLGILIPKGRKADVDTFCKEQGTTVNGLVNDLLRDRLGMTVEDWKSKKTGD